MNWKLNHRKILTFPAVHPCSGASPATLLASLITLSENITGFQSKLASTQRKNTRNSIRLVQILLIFFQEIRENHSFLSSSLVLSFSELHLTLQKLHLLLQDCFQDGARVWILMKSELVASHFSELIRDIATALDVLPMDKVYVSEEVRELVELVAHQARKAKMGLDPDDKNICKSVHSILDLFENGVEPELGVLKSVLEYLGFKNWSECNKEIKFLDELIGRESSGICDERELQLMYSLMAFLCYCRGVVFENPDYVNDGSLGGGRSSFELISCVNTEDFRCPISLELMSDPVTVSTGQTYDRSSIQKWLKAGNMLCPKTGERLTSAELVPNHSLKKLIDQFCAENGVSISRAGAQNRDISRTIVAGSAAAEQAMRLLAQFLAKRLNHGSEAEQNRAAYEVRLLAKSNIFNRSSLIETGSIPPLLRLVYSSNTMVQENAMAALLRLSKHPQGKSAIMRNLGNRGLNPVLHVLNSGLKLEAKQMAAATIFYLSSVEEYRKLIGARPEAIPGLVELIRIGTTHCKKNAIVALFGLILHPINQQRVLETDTVPLLADTLKSSDQTDLVNDAIAVLATLSENAEGSAAILQTCALQLISGLLKSSSLSRAGREYCLSALLNLTIHGGAEVTRDLARDTSLPGSLYGLVTDGTPRGSRKARTLLKMLQQHHESVSSLAFD
uniref:RING-type E3 ubiquitin transferase n=1 Tax=Kalanchoe fedtschenkoi TaxID=63787 RepID=A0A7N0RAR4_KALFE